MSVIRVTKNDFENITLVTTPNRHYSSSSSGITGSVKVFPRGSSTEKESNDTFIFNDTQSGAVVDENFETFKIQIQNTSRSKRTAQLPILEEVESYLTKVKSVPTKATAVLDVERFTPTTRFTKYTVRKNNVKDMLMHHYRVDYPSAQWSYTNYHTLNFFTAFDQLGNQLVPTSSVLLYPNVDDPEVIMQDGYVSGSYCLSGAFSFDFYINPRYKFDGIDSGHFKAGTIFHLSSSYAVSLITGSLKDVEGLPEGFRIQLQLSHSAGIPPSSAIPGPYPHDLVFLSDDNSLRYNKWHHVIIRWGTDLVEDGTGSFVIDGDVKGTFVVPSGTISPKRFTDSLNPDVLCIGNFYEGKNDGVNAQSIFFNEKNALRDGTFQITNAPAENSYQDPIQFYFRHPLKGEVHDLAIRRKYLTDIAYNSTGSRGAGASAFAKNDFAFYLPPFFTEDSPTRRWVDDHGGVMQTPFFTITGTTSDPFNVAMSFGVNGHLINLENFTKDFSTGRFPRHMFLTGSTVDYTTSAEEANTFLYKDFQISKRNLTILPCDDGEFDPNYEVLQYELRRDKYFSQGGVTDYGVINLEMMLSGAAALDAAGLGQVDPEHPTVSGYLDELVGMSPESPGGRPGPAYKNAIKKLEEAEGTADFYAGIQKNVPLTIFQRTLDPSSNQVTFFNISNLYYGRRIKPGTLMIKDCGISGSHGRVGITLRDDSMGGLYRADCSTGHATQNTVGNVFYDEGIILIKSPHLYFFGKEQFELSFKGVFNIFSTKYEVLADSGLLNSSSNITYVQNETSLKPSGEPTDNETFVYISGMNFHDDNLNVVAKAKLAQPIIKREGDKILFRVVFDY